MVSLQVQVGGGELSAKENLELLMSPHNIVINSPESDGSIWLGSRAEVQMFKP